MMVGLIEEEEEEEDQIGGRRKRKKKKKKKKRKRKRKRKSIADRRRRRCRSTEKKSIRERRKRRRRSAEKTKQIDGEEGTSTLSGPVMETSVEDSSLLPHLVPIFEPSPPSSTSPSSGSLPPITTTNPLQV
ncbi:hypothetical protein LWI29_012081 [Acer saccharum]|uniref:Uncharacterized protein n=1 Tax=Acer saccharum TaxID=4024 RepID=A0AA39SDZ1_ACESA|nr:hypothetical protein LWI29_012081 [Acer saccharum]